MTLPRGAGRALYAGNGQAVEFPFLFKVWEEEQLSVLITSPGGVTSPASGWTATLDEDGGTVRYLHEGAPLPEGWKLAIVRDMPFVQEVDLVTGTRFDPEVIETALDMAAAERQQLLERLARAVVVEPTDERAPESLMDEIRSARDTAAASAVGAAGSALAAQAARGESEASAATAAAERAGACLCAQRAEAAAEAAEASAILAKTTEIQAPTASRRGGIRVGRGLQLVAGPDGVVDVLEPVAGLAISETEGAVATKAVTVSGLVPHAGARLCLLLTEANTAEAPALAVNPDGGGSPLPILWAGSAPAPGELAASVPWLLVCDGSAWHVTGPRPDGVTLTARPDGSLAALGSALLCNTRAVITESGEWAAPVAGWYRVTCIGGGGGGGKGGSYYNYAGAGGEAGGASSVSLADVTVLSASGGGGGGGGGGNGTGAAGFAAGGGGGGGAGEMAVGYVRLEAGVVLACVIGAGGAGGTQQATAASGTVNGGGERGGLGANHSFQGGNAGFGGNNGHDPWATDSSHGSGGAGGNGAPGPLGNALGAGGGGGGGYSTGSHYGLGGKSLAHNGAAGAGNEGGNGGAGGPGAVLIEYHDPALVA